MSENPGRRFAAATLTGTFITFPSFPMNHSPSVRAVSVVALMLGMAACSRNQESPNPKPKMTAEAAVPVGALPKIGPAPAWKLQDVNGQVLSSEQFKGKVVVLDFWATWCGPCRMEIPGYVELTRKYGKDGLVIIGVSVDQGGPEVVKPFSAKMGVNYPIVMANEQVKAAFGGIEAIPTTFIIDRAGVVRHKKVGAEETAEYEQKILAVLKEKA
ncbi:MAG: TlpA family protein disulfide reductase [Opitutus sp.]|nr:TlpA family protein disulfide reductase [Opitutus sp.]